MNQTPTALVSSDSTSAHSLARHLSATEMERETPSSRPLRTAPGTSAWRWRFSAGYALAALAIFLIEAAIATVGKHIIWLRWYAGDVIVVGFVHCLLAMVVEAPTRRVALAAFAVACAVEFSQYVSHLMGWVIANPVLRIIVGSTPDWMDVLSYALGTLLILAVAALPKALRA